MTLLPCFNEDSNISEIGVDEAGRGPMFGRVYSAAVILPKDNSFRHDLMKDSKKFHSKKKITEAFNYIKENSIAYNISFEEHTTIDKHNILSSTYMAMHSAINNIIDFNVQNMLLIDGNNFKPFTYFNNDTECIASIPHTCVVSGDNKYSAIAAASILAKVARDTYIEELCNQNQYLIDNYDILNNKGYGTKLHIAGIQKHGISPWHRRTFGICKTYDTALAKLCDDD